MKRWEVQPRDCFGLFDVSMTHQAYGPVLAVVWWKKECEEPNYWGQLPRAKLPAPLVKGGGQCQR